MSCCWSIFVIGHLSGYVKKSRIYVLSGILMAYLIAIIINCFIPYIFSVDSDGVYHREGIAYYSNVLLAVVLFVIDPLFNYIRIKRSGGLLKFFPIWLFYLPAATGILFQTLFYGISTIYVGLCLGVCGILMASQNDMIFRDKLTSLYNRYYLDRLKERLSRKRGNQNFTVMMLDLNGFKKINDNYGHLTGDEALITTANLLREAVGSYGNIIRYAGDEFVIILNIEEEIQIQEKIIHIRETFDAFNEKHLVPYTLSVSIGYSKTNFKDYTIDEIMNDIDKKMYIDKMKQHELHPEWSR
jgi:diguanylate cyclase (GGDEF)-like protein